MGSPAIRWSRRARASSCRAGSATTCVIETSLTAVRRSSFDITHRLTRDGTLAVEGFETRVWAVHDPARPGGFKAQPIPPQLVARLTAA